MNWIIISNETFESNYGTIHKGDTLETVIGREKKDLQRYLHDKYGPTGENIKIKYRRLPKWNS